jgi:hypothetical protein
MESQEQQRRGLDRRALIKRAAVTGAIVWTAPVVLDSMVSPAGAFSGTPCSSVTCDTAKPSKTCTWYAFRIIPGSTDCGTIGGGGSTCAAITSALAALAAAGINPEEKCPPGTKVTSSTSTTVTFTLGPGCNLAVASDFAGGDCCDSGPGGGTGGGSCTFTFGQCNGHNISHVDAIVCCCG